VPLPRVGRIISDGERVARSTNEAAATLPGETLRTAFAISNRHVITAWHCVRDDFRSGNPLWYRVRAPGAKRLYLYIPVRISNYDDPFDTAALTIDEERLSDANLSLSQAEHHLTEVSVALAGHVSHGDDVVLVGFPASGSAADSDTNSGTVVDTDLALGEVVGMKIEGRAFGAASPVDPHGLSGGPVLREVTVGSNTEYSAVGVVRAVPQGIVPHAAAGGSVIASRLSDLVGLIPEIAVALSRGTAQELAAAVALSSSSNETGRDHSLGLGREQSFLSLSQECLKALATTAVHVPDPSRGELTGWAHFFDEPHEHLRPTAISTAYGLKIALTIDAPSGSLDRSRLTETLWKLRLNDGGWAARTGREYSRPETTALVLGALASAGYDRSRLAEAGEAFDKALSVQADPVARNLVYPTCAGIRGLVRARPDSSRLPELRSSLLEGAISDSTNRDLTCWAGQLASKVTNARLVPSVVHTAMAIVSLARANVILGPDERSTAALEQAVVWLSQHPDLANRSEQIRRVVNQHDDQRDLLNVNHFTAGWVARALLSVRTVSAPEAEALLLSAVRHVWLAQRGGVWNWEEDVRPVWMTYQGLCVLRDYSMLRGLEFLIDG
jgi:hypothetical protein